MQNRLNKRLRQDFLRVDEGYGGWIGRKVRSSMTHHRSSHLFGRGFKVRGRLHRATALPHLWLWSLGKWMGDRQDAGHACV
jgi:hypothetical protein